MPEDIIHLMRRETWRAGRASRTLPNNDVIAVRRFGGKYHDRYEWYHSAANQDPQPISLCEARELLQPLEPNSE